MIKIKMKGWLYKIYENDEGRKAFMYIHLNKTVRYIIDDTNIPSKTGTFEHLDKELNRLGYHFVEEKPVDFVTERQKRRQKRDARRAYKVYMQEHPEIAAQHKLKREETIEIREHINDDQNKDAEWTNEFEKIRKLLPKDPEKKKRWIEKYNETHEKFTFSIETGKTKSGFDYEAYRLCRK